VNDDDVKRRKTFFPPNPPFTLRKDNHPSNFNGTDPHFVCPRLENHVSFRPVLVHLMTYCNNLHERTSPIEIFSSDHHLTRLDRPDAASDPYAPCKLGPPPRIDVHNPMLPKSSVAYAFIPNSLPRSRSQLLKKSILRSSFVHCPHPTRSGTVCIPSTPIPQPNGKNCFSAALHSSSLRSVYIITTQFFVLLRSPFFFFSESQKRTLNHSCPPPSHVGFVACVRADGVMVRVQTVWIDRLLSFSSRTILFAYYWQ
jgi:hypothetical protein